MSHEGEEDPQPKQMKIQVGQGKYQTSQGIETKNASWLLNKFGVLTMSVSREKSDKTENIYSAGVQEAKDTFIIWKGGHFQACVFIYG